MDADDGRRATAAMLRLTSKLGKHGIGVREYFDTMRSMAPPDGEFSASDLRISMKKAFGHAMLSREEAVHLVRCLDVSVAFRISVS